jgi:hypothetical protein
MVERKYQQGDRVRVLAHESSICNVTIFCEGFVGYVIKEYESKSQQYVEIEGEGKYPGYRVIAKEHVVPLEVTGPEVIYDGEFYIITCECGKLRKIQPQHVNQVKRCEECQKEYNKKTAKARYKRRRK